MDGDHTLQHARVSRGGHGHVECRLRILARARVHQHDVVGGEIGLGDGIHLRCSDDLIEREQCLLDNPFGVCVVAGQHGWGFLRTFP